MGTYRNITTLFWTDRKVDDDFSPEDKYFYLYLITNPHTNICGCYEIGMKQMCNELGYNKDTILKLFERMDKEHGVVKYDTTTKEVLVLNWHKYNWSKSEKVIKAVRSVAAYIKSDEFREYVLGKADEKSSSITERQITDKQITDKQITEKQKSDTDVSIGYKQGMDRVSKRKKKTNFKERQTDYDQLERELANGR